MSGDTGSSKKTREENIAYLEEYFDTLSETDAHAFQEMITFLAKNPSAWDLLKELIPDKFCSWPDTLVYLYNNTPNAVQAHS